MSGDYGVGPPDWRHRFSKAGCWAHVMMRSTGAMYQGTDNCGNKARPDKLTCKRHDRFEAAAQRKKEKS